MFALLSQIFLLFRCFHSLSGRSRGHASFIYMCSYSLSKADLDHSMNHIRHPTDFSAAHLHFGSESIVPTLLPFSSHIPRVFVCQILGKLLGLTHSTKRLWRKMCLSSFLPSLSTPSVLLLLSFCLCERDSDQPGLMTTGMQFAVLSSGNLRKSV